ncbi:PEP-utilising protein mobile region [Stanieria sp. NIES-3757]|nr:PEP-utilising protein mobile region [Stanieria sp. NIES-3757]
MKHLYWLSQINPSEQSLVGEKVFILSQLLQHGYPILPGYVIGTPILKEFLENFNDAQSLIANLPNSSLHLNVDNYLVLQSVAQKSRQIILETPFPDRWQAEIFAAATKLNTQTLIVRPSLVVSHHYQRMMTGLWRSHCCWCQPEALTQTIKKVWADLFGAKSLFYWQKLGIDLEKLNLAVLIQPLYNAKASGIVELKSDRLFISATSGLGHSLLRGEIQPDYYEIDRQTSAIINGKLGSKTLAYRLPDTKEAAGENCLEVYLTSETEQEQFALDDDALTRLIELIKDLAQKRRHINYLEWTLLQNTTDKYYFTQLNYFSTSSWQSTNQPLLTGVAAASGIVKATVQVNPNSLLSAEQIKPGSIVVLKELAPHQIALLQQIGGIVTEQGGITSHGAILARELGIPAIVGVAQATQLLQTGDKILLNGNTGKIYRLSPEEKMMMNSWDREETKTQIKSKWQNSDRYSSNESLVLNAYPIATQLMVNLSQANLVDSAANLPVDGVGLIRAELMLADLITSDDFLDPALSSNLLGEIINRLSQFVAKFAPRPVFYRSLDYCFGAEKTRSNPIVGKRGTYSYLSDSSLFKLELSALAQLYLEGYTNCHLILPFVRSVAEVRYCRRLIEEVGLTRQPDFQLWMMAEIPSVIFLIEEYVQAGIQGIAIGTNDLTQLLLGIDREQPEFATSGLTANHPAVSKAIAQIIKAAQLAGIPCSICGQAPVQYPHLIDQLIRWGITTISVEPEAVISTYNAIARAEHRLCLEVARQSLPTTI